MRASVLIVVAAAALIVSGCEKKSDPEPLPIRPGLTTVVEPRTTQLFGPFSGTIEPRTQTALGFRIPGRMTARDVTVGDLVKKDQRLAALDPTVVQLQVTSAATSPMPGTARQRCTQTRQQTLARAATPRSRLSCGHRQCGNSKRGSRRPLPAAKGQDQLGYSGTPIMTAS